MELVELQCSDELKSKFHAEGVLLLDFYKKYLECKQYPNLINHAKKMASMFGNTYVGEQLFSSMKVTKSKLRIQLNDGHLQDILLLATSNLTPNFINFQAKNNIKYLIDVVTITIIVNIFCIFFQELSKSRVILISFHNNKMSKNHTFYNKLLAEIYYGLLRSC